MEFIYGVFFFCIFVCDLWLEYELVKQVNCVVIDCVFVVVVVIGMGVVEFQVLCVLQCEFDLWMWQIVQFQDQVLCVGLFVGVVCYRFWGVQVGVCVVGC